MRCRVPALCLVPGINIHVVVDHRNTNLLIGFLNVFVILALVFLALTCAHVVHCLHEQVFQNGQSCGALELSNPECAGTHYSSGRVAEQQAHQHDTCPHSHLCAYSRAALQSSVSVW